jgi:hypothetical protein
MFNKEQQKILVVILVLIVGYVLFISKNILNSILGRTFLVMVMILATQYNVKLGLGITLLIVLLYSTNYIEGMDNLDSTKPSTSSTTSTSTTPSTTPEPKDDQPSYLPNISFSSIYGLTPEVAKTSMCTSDVPTQEVEDAQLEKNPLPSQNSGDKINSENKIRAKPSSTNNYVQMPDSMTEPVPSANGLPTNFLGYSTF